jgi:hypothetical protein
MGNYMPLEWTAETLRLSVFFPEMAELKLADWKKVTGKEEPETLQSAAGRRSMIGPFLGGVIQMNALGPRIDCIILPKAPTETMEEGYIPNIGTFKQICKDFVEATAPWLAGIARPINRVAFGGVALSKREDLRDAHETLLGLLQSVNGDPDKMKELNFRVNWPKNSRNVNGLVLNRITNWSVLQIRLQLVVQAGQQTIVNDGALSIVIRMEFDHNTDGDRTDTFEPKVLVPIYDELAALALENAEKGEVK